MRPAGFIRTQSGWKDQEAPLRTSRQIAVVGYNDNRRLSANGSDEALEVSIALAVQAVVDIIQQEDARAQNNRAEDRKLLAQAGR